MICPVCGTENRAGARFCRQCGAILSVTPVAPVDAEPIAAASGDLLPAAPELAAQEPANELPADESADDAPVIEPPAVESAPEAESDEAAADEEAAPELAPVTTDEEAVPSVEPVTTDEEPELSVELVAANEQATPETEAVPANEEVAADVEPEEDHATVELTTATLDDKPTIKLSSVALEDVPTAELSPGLVADDQVAPHDEATSDAATAPQAEMAANDDTTSELTPGGIGLAEVTNESTPEQAASAPGSERGELALAGGYTVAGDAAKPAPDVPTAGGDEPIAAQTTGAEGKPTMLTGGQRETRKLDEDDAAEVAPTAPGDPFPALKEGDLVAGRYRVQQVLQTGPQRQTYLAADEKGYQRCWACGSTHNAPGETYCNDCGAQLSGRAYRLYELPPTGDLPDIPERLAEVGIPAVAQIVEGLTDETSGRHYVVVEDTGGHTMAELIAEADAKEAARPSGERLLNWMTQAADMLDELQKMGAIGCDFSPTSLHVLADERVLMADPVSCRLVGKNDADDKQADTQRAAAALEQIYGGLSGQPMDKTPAYNAQSGKPEDVAAILRAGREGRYKSAGELSGALRDLFDTMTPPRDMQLISGRSTDVGVQRELNEDSLLVLEFLAMEAAGSMPVGIYVVADGMGGHQSGEVASSIAIRTVGSILQSKVLAGQVTGEDHLPDPERTTSVVREAVLEANRRIVELGQQRQSDMGTTVTMALVIGNQVTIANVGDSRTYLYRDGRLQQISRDHSLVARLVAAGQLSTEESRYFERRNEIYLALGDPHLAADQIDVFNRTLRPFDSLLLCSDGLWEMVPDVQIEGILRGAPDDSAAAQSLVNEANKNGGEDNISVIVAQAVIADKAKKNQNAA